MQLLVLFAVAVVTVGGVLLVLFLVLRTQRSDG
jgi:hypothetical protein